MGRCALPSRVDGLVVNVHFEFRSFTQMFPRVLGSEDQSLARCVKGSELGRGSLLARPPLALATQLEAVTPSIHVRIIAECGSDS